MGTAWPAVPAASSPSHLALSNTEVVFAKNKTIIPYSKNISKLWGRMSKMLPVALTHLESDCVPSGQGDNLLFVKSAGMEQHKQHQLLTVTAFKNFLSGHRREEEKYLHP